LAFLGFRKFKRLGYGKVLPMRLTLLMLTLSLAVIFLQARVGQIPVLLAFYPASVFMSKYVESIQRKWHKDFVLLVFLVVGITAFAID
jgi:hypothetical protein